MSSPRRPRREDNDHDGHTDLEDEACACDDGIDNDRDGYIDAADYECRTETDDGG